MEKQILTFLEAVMSMVVERLLAEGGVEFQNGQQWVKWELHGGDFPALLRSSVAQQLAKPHAIVFDPWSPAKNPAMWCAPVFNDLFRLLDPARACAMPTYSRSTMLRVTLLLAGFYVGSGPATGTRSITWFGLRVLARWTTPRSASK